MKVKYINTLTNEPNLSSDKVYLVISIEFSNLESNSGDYIKYRIMNDQNMVIPYSARHFEVVSDRLSQCWIYNMKSKDNFSILPKDIAYNQFWEEYYNSDKHALEAFDNAIQKVFIEELSNNEIKEILNGSNDYKINLILKALRKFKNYEYVEEVIKLIETRFSTSHTFTKEAIDSVLVVGFEYLGNIKTDDIEKFFLKYYENVEYQCKELDKIVNEYFSSN